VWFVRASFATAYFDEQRRKQAEARVPFLLVTYSLGKQRKVTRQGAKKNGKFMNKRILKITGRARLALRFHQP
jgi:hypothetical protein